MQYPSERVSQLGRDIRRAMRCSRQFAARQKDRPTFFALNRNWACTATRRWRKPTGKPPAAAKLGRASVQDDFENRDDKWRARAKRGPSMSYRLRRSRA